MRGLTLYFDVILGIFEAVKVKNSFGKTDLYIDGGLICNYPIHAFDGTYVCMYVCSILISISIW